MWSQSIELTLYSAKKPTSISEEKGMEEKERREERREKELIGSDVSGTSTDAKPSNYVR